MDSNRVAQISKSAVSPTSKSAGCGSMRTSNSGASAGLETRDTADLEICATSSGRPRAGLVSTLADLWNRQLSPRSRHAVACCEGRGSARLSPARRGLSQTNGRRAGGQTRTNRILSATLARCVRIALRPRRETTMSVCWMMQWLQKTTTTYLSLRLNGQGREQRKQRRAT